MMRRGLALALTLLWIGTAAPHIGSAQPSRPTVLRVPVDVPGAQEQHTPPEYNRALALRYFAVGASAPRAVLVLIPGLNSGPNTLDILARALVSRDETLEVWAIGPRATLLQDRRGITAALAYQDPDFALGYYYGGLSIDGKTYQPLADAAVPFAAYWGLDVHLRDVRAIVGEAHRRYPTARVFLGGHSLGGILAALYAGYDFGRTPGPQAVATDDRGRPMPSADAGDHDIAGLVLLDGAPLSVIPRLSSSQYLDGIHIPLFPNIPGVRQLLGVRGHAAPFADINSVAQPKISILLDIITTYAYFQPDRASTLPFYPRGAGQAIDNEALFAGVLSDQTQPDLFIRTSIGSPVGVFDRVPDPAHINPNGLLVMPSGRPAPGHALVEWMPYGDDPPPGRVDLRSLETAILEPGADFTQWYVPWRLVLDLGLSSGLDTSDEFSRRFVSLTQVRFTTVPILVLGAGNGLIRSERQTKFYLSHVSTPPDDIRVKILPGLTHLDIENADDNPAVPEILDWLNAMIH
jgi:hypothetical protein